VCSQQPVEGEFCNEDTGLCQPLTSVDVPTLSQWGLIAMVGIMGIAGFVVIRRKKLIA